MAPKESIFDYAPNRPFKPCVVCEEMILRSEVTSNNQKTHEKCQDTFTKKRKFESNQLIWARKAWPILVKKMKAAGYPPPYFIKDPKTGKLWPSSSLMSPIHIGMKRRKKKEISLRQIQTRKDFLKNNPGYIPVKYRKAAERLAKREVTKALAKAEYQSQPLEGPRTGLFGSVD